MSDKSSLWLPGGGASSAFAAVLGDGSVVTWGDPWTGGNSNAVQGCLTDVQKIQASARAHAAILGDGSVVTWGDPELGTAVPSRSSSRMCGRFRLDLAHLRYSCMMGPSWPGVMPD